VQCNIIFFISQLCDISTLHVIVNFSFAFYICCFVIVNIHAIYLWCFASYMGVSKFRYWVTWPRPRSLVGRFMVHTQEGSVLYVRTKFEADSSIPSKLIWGSQNFEIGSRDPDHAHLRVILWSARRRGPSSVYIPNLLDNKKHRRYERLAATSQLSLW